MPPAGTEAALRWDDWSLLEKNAWLWGETNRWILNFLESLPLDQRVTIRSEDLFDGEPEAMKSFFGQLGVGVPERSQLAGVLGKNLNRQRTGSFPEWGDWSDEQREQVQPHVEDLMQRFGYPSPATE